MVCAQIAMKDREFFVGENFGTHMKANRAEDFLLVHRLVYPVVVADLTKRKQRRFIWINDLVERFLVVAEEKLGGLQRGLSQTAVCAAMEGAAITKFINRGEENN